MHAPELVDYYPVSGYELKNASDNTRGRLASVATLVTEAEVQHRGVLANVEAQLEVTMQDAPADVLTRATQVNRSAEWAAGCLEFFGIAVDDYNFRHQTYPKSVSGINAEWASLYATSFGVSYDDYTDGATDPADAYTEYAAAFSAARGQAQSRLLAENTVAKGRLDDAATEVATMLEGGPTDDAVRTLWAAGALPFYAPLIFTDVDLTQTATTPAVAHDLEAYLDAHPEDRFDPYLQVLQSTVVEVMPSQDEIDDSLVQLREAGLLDEDEEPDAYYLAWLTWSLRKGLGPDDIVERAEQEDVSMDSFDTLRELESVMGPDGRMYFLLDGDQGAVGVARATELMHGGTPSITDVRRSNNEWTYDGFMFSDSDVELVQDNGGVIVSTPEGTLMAAAGPSGILPNTVDLLTGGSGTTWMEMFVLDGSNDDPEQRLRSVIENGAISENPEGHPLAQVLLHERLHSAQWAEYGYSGFVARYLTESATVGGAGDCGNDFEGDAIFDWGGYETCTPWD